MSADTKANVLLAVDLGPAESAWHIRAAINLAADLARDGGDHVVVLHVREFSVWRLAPMMLEHGGAAGCQAVEEIVSRLRGVGVSASALIREADGGHVAQTILDVADEFNARFIVLSSPRHRVTVRRVAQQLIRQADVPVAIQPRS